MRRQQESTRSANPIIFERVQGTEILMDTDKQLSSILRFLLRLHDMVLNSRLPTRKWHTCKSQNLNDWNIIRCTWSTMTVTDETMMNPSCNKQWVGSWHGSYTMALETGDINLELDDIDRLVQEIWLESPGIGNKALREQVQQRLPPTTTVTIKRIKKSKALLPYRCISPTKHENHDFIERKLQERQSLRIERRFDQADHIYKGLEAMSIVIDDVCKTWTVGEGETTPQQDSSDSVLSCDSGVPCKMCGRYFASRNLVFNHLRDPSSGCGTSIFASGQELDQAPSVKIKAQRQQQRQSSCIPSAPGKTARHAPASHCVWLGDIPLVWSRYTGQNKRLRAIMFAHLPRTIQEPWIKKVVRKSYRSRETDEYLGYAILVFRDEQEASKAREVLNNKEVTPDNTFSKMNTNVQNLPSFVLKARPSESGDTTAAETAWTCAQEGGQDPPLHEQLRPLALSELVHRINQIEPNPESQVSISTPTEALYHEQHQEALERLLALNPKRTEVYLHGRPIPDALCKELLEILTNLKWPARNERPRLTSERYFVLPTNVTNDRFYGELRQACRSLMDWVDPLYYYSGIAVTKNFVASPHVDVKDRNYQYAVALGDFVGGGQLCVEGVDGDEITVNVVDTHNRIARVDGRHVHWVRTWEMGDRYSLIFYDTSDRNAMESTDGEGN